MHPLWIRVPGIIIGVIIFLYIWLYLMATSSTNDDYTSNNAKKKKSDWPMFLCFSVVPVGIVASIFAWNEERVVAAFAELFVAQLLNLLVPVGSALIGYFIGNKIYNKTGPKWLGWTVGIIVFILLSFSLMEVCHKIPGVGWRMERSSEESQNVIDDNFR